MFFDLTQKRTKMEIAKGKNCLVSYNQSMTPINIGASTIGTSDRNDFEVETEV